MTARWAVRAASASPAGEGESFFGNQKQTFTVWWVSVFLFQGFERGGIRIFQKELDKHNTSCYDVLHERRYRMDVQLKRGLLDVCVLAAIKSEDSYGYRIIKDLKPYIELSESTLYTILKRLEAADMLTVRTAEHGGRLRKYYHITEEGRKRIEEFKSEWKEILSIYQFVTKEDAGHE